MAVICMCLLELGCQATFACVDMHHVIVTNAATFVIVSIIMDHVWLILSCYAVGYHSLVHPGNMFDLL